MNGANHGVRKSVATRDDDRQAVDREVVHDGAGLAGQHEPEVLVGPQGSRGVHDARTIRSSNDWAPRSVSERRTKKSSVSR